MVVEPHNIMAGSNRSAMEEWLSTRPRCVQEMAREFPPGASFIMAGVLHYIVGYREPDVLMVSPFNPAVDYDRALAHKKYMCAEHLR